MQIRGRLYCDGIVSTEKKTLRRGNIHAFPWILPCFAVAKLITCSSERHKVHLESFSCLGPEHEKEKTKLIPGVPFP